MINCPNCGAEIEEDVTKCPYCEYINLPGAEKEFNEKIEKIKTNIAETKKEPGKALKKGFFSGVKTIVLTILALLVLIIIIVGLLLHETKNRPPLVLNAEQEAEAVAYRALAEEQIIEAYENKDIDRLAAIFDKAFSEDRVSLWGVAHYEAAQAASNYRSLMRCMPNLEKEKMTKKEAEEITYYCFYFYYKAYGTDAAELFDPVRENEILPIIWDRLMFTEQEMESFRSEVMDAGLVNRSNVYHVAKKQFKQYH